jgi:hypothetical protein
MDKKRENLSDMAGTEGGFNGPGAGILHALAPDSHHGPQDEDFALVGITAAELRGASGRIHGEQAGIERGISRDG